FTALYTQASASELRDLPAIETLRRVWIQNFAITDGQIRWRENDNTPPAGRYISSPYDTDARYATKRQTEWIGYKIHLTETYGDDQPNLITNV
ncbi:IS5/IS1182 family transposase, partial [Enterococcus casseliflavus]